MSMHRGFTVASQIARRSLVVCAVSSLIASTALTPLSAAFAQAQQSTSQQAQDQQPWPGPPITAQNQAGDPPARAGRISKIDGTVSFHTADEDQWGPATLNYPLTNGNALWTEPGARAELQLGSANRLVMDGKSELNVTTLDDSVFEASLPQGSAYLNLQDIAPGESYTIRTPRGIVQLNQPGRYTITAGDDDTPTTVTTLAGAPAQLAERGLTQSVPAGQTATLNGPLDGDEPVKVAVAPGQPSAFAQSAMAEERQTQAGAPPPPVPNVAAAPAPTPSKARAPVPAPVPAPAAMPVQVQGMTGAQDLAAYGSWSTAPEYGSVWYPPVQAGWVPYRHGHWAWVHPWGWTWVADEPWGFAPFHYGRWVMVHDRWAWSPGAHHRHHHHHHHPRPVYAPALVAFFGGGGGRGVSVSVSIGRDVGWVPLGWHEPYYPPYRVSRNYIRNVNVTHVTNITKVTNVTVNNTTVNRYTNRNSATFVQADTMRHSRPVQQGLQRVDDRQMQAMRTERRPQIQPDRQRPAQAAPGPRIDQASLRRTEPGRNEAGRGDPRGQTGGPREMSRRQDQQPATRQEQRPQQMQRDQQARQQPDQQQRQRSDQRPEVQRQERQPQQVHRDQRPQQEPQRQQEQRQAQPERQRSERQQQPQMDQQRQMQQERQRSDNQRQEQQRRDQQRQQAQQHRDQQMRQQADQQRQMQQQAQREQQMQQQRQQQDMQSQQREQQIRQQAEQQRQQVQQDQRRQQEAQSQAQGQAQSQAQNQRQQQEPRQQRRREADL